MCGRFSLTKVEAQVLTDRFGVTEVCRINPNYNISPTQEVAVILNDSVDKISLARWGLIPSWAKDEKIAYRTINARAESVREKASFREPFKTRRCLVLSDGFYEWEQPQKTPFRIGVSQMALFAMAGIWEAWNGQITFSIITCPANNFMSDIHDRMPVILPKETEMAWLGGINQEKALSLLKPYPGQMEKYPVSKEINSPKNNVKELVLPAVS